MNIINKSIKDVIPYEKNPRINKEAVKYVAESIQQFGFKVPIIIDKNNVIIAGHTRLLAAKKLGFETVPCIMADDLSEDQVKAFRLADNKVAEFSEWDMDLLAEELADLETFDMEVLGFEEPEELDTAEAVDDEFEPVVPEEPKAKPGQNVADLFGGSGTTLMACEQMNRKCYMMEYDPRFVDVIIERWEQYTGQKAVLLNE